MPTLLDCGPRTHHPATFSAKDSENRVEGEVTLKILLERIRSTILDLQADVSACVAFHNRASGSEVATRWEVRVTFVEPSRLYSRTHELHENAEDELREIKLLPGFSAGRLIPVYRPSSASMVARPAGILRTLEGCIDLQTRKSFSLSMRHALAEST